MTLLLPHRGLSPLNTLCIPTVCVYFLSASSLLPVLLNSEVLRWGTRHKNPLHFTLSGIKAETARLDAPSVHAHTNTHTYTQMKLQGCRLEKCPLCPTPSHSAILFPCSPLPLSLYFYVLFLFAHRKCHTVDL